MKLNDADTLYIGATPVDKVYAGANLVWEAVPPSLPDSTILVSYTPGSDRNDFTGEVGVRLGIGTTPMTVRWLGLRNNGYGGVRTVKIYEWFTAAVERTVTVNYGGTAVGEYAWAVIEPPLVMGANGYYAVLMVCTAGDGMVWRNPGPVTYDPVFSNIYDSYWAGSLQTGMQNGCFVGIDLGWNTGDNPSLPVSLPAPFPPPGEVHNPLPGSYPDAV